MVLTCLALFFASLVVLGALACASRRFIAALGGGGLLLPGCLGLGAVAAEMARRWAGLSEQAAPWVAGIVAIATCLAAVVLIGDQASGIRHQRRRPRTPRPAAWLPVVALVLLVPAAAHADESTRIDLTPVITYGVDIAAAVLAALGAWAVRRLSTWLRLAEDSRVREYLDDALTRGLVYAREVALRAGEDIGHPDVRSAIVARAAAYVLPKVPEALARFGVTPACLAERLTARLPDVAYEAPHPVTAAPAAAGTGSRDEDIPL